MKVAFYTLGCKVNQYETDLMMKLFEDIKCSIVNFNEKADVYIVNSCSVTNLSTRKTRQALSKAKKNEAVVVLVGCYAQEIKDSCNLKNVDLVLGNEEKKDIVKYVQEYIDKKVNKVEYKISDIENVRKYVEKSNLEKGINVRESVKIEDGCNNFCSYCIIPYVRGRVRSRSIDDILNEVGNLVKSGVKEIVLVGIEIASYGKDLESSLSLINVVEEVSKIYGLERVRLGSIEPRILTDDNILRLSKITKLCPHFHISVQSLDNSVLKRMNRHYKREDVLSIISKIRSKIKNAAFTCDIIVGFPGETDEEFNNTLEGVKEARFYEAHVFKYSKRKWTRAATMDEQVSGEVSDKRSKELINVASDLKRKFLESYISTKQLVLFESYADGYLYGYTSNYIMTKVKGDKKLWGKIQEIELQEVDKDLILGNI